MTGSPERVAEAMYRALDADDVPGFLDLCADDVTIRYPADGRLAYGGEWNGPDRAAAFLDTHDDAEEILVFDVHEMLERDGTVCALGTFTGRVKPTGREWSTRFVHLLTVEEGRLKAWEAFFDTAAAIEAHGAR